MNKIIYSLTQKRVFGQKYFPCYFLADVCIYATIAWILYQVIFLNDFIA